MSKTRQHQPLRVPNGWKEQDRALVIQLERLFDELYSLTSRLEDISVTDVAYNATTKKLTLTIDGETSDITKIAILDGNDKIPASLLPSYVDDVEEYADLAHFPATGEGDKIYVAKDTGFTYRWSGTQYVRLNTYDEATQSSSGLMSASDKTKLDGVEEGANNYSLPLADSSTRGGIKVGYTQDGQKYPVQLSSEKAYVEVPWNDTKNSAGTMNRVNKKLFLVGAETQATNPTTNSNANVYIGTDNCLYSNGNKVLTSHQDISGKADKVNGATNNNFAALDSNGNLKDSGHKHSDYLTSHQDISGKVNKAGDTMTGNLHRQVLGVDVTKADNNVGSVQYPYLIDQVDDNGLMFVNTQSIVLADGRIGWMAYIRNYHTDGETYELNRFGFYVAKNGTTEYIIDNPGSFKSALAPFTWGQLAGH